MVRLRTRDGDFVEGPVELQARMPSGDVKSWTAHAAQGLCLVRFHAGQRIDLEFRKRAPNGGELRGFAQLTRDEVATGYAPVVWLE
jgi:hypothetical protein